MKIEGVVPNFQTNFVRNWKEFYDIELICSGVIDSLQYLGQQSNGPEGRDDSA